MLTLRKRIQVNPAHPLPPNLSSSFLLHVEMMQVIEHSIQILHCSGEVENHQHTSVHTLPDTRCFSESMIFVTGLRWTVKVWKSWGPDPTVSGCCTITLTAPELVPYAISIQLPLTPKTRKNTVVPPGIKAWLTGSQESSISKLLQEESYIF